MFRKAALTIAAAALAVTAATAAAAPTLIQQPSQPGSASSGYPPVAHCGELCGLSGWSALGSG